MSATNKDSDKEAERASNDDGENPGGSKGDDGRGNPDNAEDDDGDYENLDDTSDEDSDYDNPEDAEDDNSTENPGGSKGDGGKENPGGSKGDGGKENPGDTPEKTEKTEKDKFKIASDLSNYIHEVWDRYVNCLKNTKDKNERIMGVILYITHKFSLRTGSSTEVATGVCTLKKRHITLNDDGSVFFDFIGKWDIRYKKTHTVEPSVYKILQELQKDKDSEYLFPSIMADNVNKCLKEIMPKLTIMVFRTYNGSLRMQNELEKATLDVTKRESVCAVYTKALEIVAAYLNHQRAAQPQASSPGNQNVDNLAESTSKLTLATQPQEKAGRVLTNMEWNPQSTKKYYIDHRVVILWCKKNKIPIEYIYTEEDRKSFKWDIDEIEKLLEKSENENELFQTFLYSE